MWNTNTENLRLRTEPQLRINSHIENLRLRTEPQLKIDSQGKILELQSETKQNVDSVMTVQDAIEQNERNEKIDILSRIRWTIERLYDNITKGKSMANSIDYMFFMAYYK